MFSRSKLPEKIIVPLDAMAVLYPDLPLWLRHSASIENVDFSASCKLNRMAATEGSVVSFIYTLIQNNPDQLSRIELNNARLALQFGSMQDNDFQSAANIVVTRKQELLPDFPQDFLIIDNIEFSRSLVDAFQKHFATKEDINSKPITERFLYFILTGIVSDSESIAPKVVGAGASYTNLLTFFERCGERIDTVIRQHGKTIDEVFFTPVEIGGDSYLAFQTEIAERMKVFAIETAEKHIDGFIASARPATNPGMLALPKPEVIDL